MKKEAATILALAFSQRQTLPDKVLDAVYLTLLDETINANTLPLLLIRKESFPSNVADDLLYLINHSNQTSVKDLARKLLQNQTDVDAKVQEFLQYDQMKDRNQRLQTMLHSKNDNDISQALKMIRAMIIIEKKLPDEIQSSMSELLDSHHDQIAGFICCSTETRNRIQIIDFSIH